VKDVREDEVERIARAAGWWLVHREVARSGSVYLTFAKPLGGEFVVRVSDHRCSRRWSLRGSPMFSVAVRSWARIREAFPAWLQRSQSRGLMKHNACGG